MALSAPPGVAAYSNAITGQGANVVVTGTIGAVGPGLPFPIWGPMNLLVWGAFASALTTTAGSLNATTAGSGAMAPGTAINSVNVPLGTTWATFSGGSGTLALPTQTFSGSITSGSKVLILSAPPSNLATLTGSTITGLATGIPASTTITGPGSAPNSVLLSNNATATTANVQVPDVFRLALTANAITVSGADANATFTGLPIVFNATLNVERSLDGGLTWIICNLGGSGQPAQFTANTPISISFGEPEKNVLYRINTLVFSAVSGVTINYRLSATGQATTTVSVPAIS